jgi:hypothetical protein
MLRQQIRLLSFFSALKPHFQAAGTDVPDCILLLKECDERVMIRMLLPEGKGTAVRYVQIMKQNETKCGSILTPIAIC